MYMYGLTYGKDPDRRMDMNVYVWIDLWIRSGQMDERIHLLLPLDIEY